MAFVPKQRAYNGCVFKSSLAASTTKHCHNDGRRWPTQVAHSTTDYSNHKHVENLEEETDLRAAVQFADIASLCDLAWRGFWESRKMSFGTE